MRKGGTSEGRAGTATLGYGFGNGLTTHLISGSWREKKGTAGGDVVQDAGEGELVLYSPPVTR